jgi:hypothetical protein
VACPFFAPIEPWSENSRDPWSGPRRVPLGEPYRGKCALTADAIDPHAQAELCNFGYARGRCAYFPDSANDAVRFSITNSVDERIQLIWIAERGHAPVTHGAAHYAHGQFDPALPQEMHLLGRVFVETYLKGKCPQGIRK